MKRVYVYALVERPARSLRIANRAIHIVECPHSSKHHGQSAIVNRESAIDNVYAAIEHRARAPELSEASLKIQHEIVAGLARRFDGILPVRFGAHIDQQELFRIVDQRREVLAEALARVRGQEQMTVRIFGGEPAAGATLTVGSTGTAYLERRRAAQHGPLPPVAEQIRGRVRVLATCECVEQSRPNVRAVLHHMIPKGRAADYARLVEEATLVIPHSERVTVSGPFAPFAFVPDIWT